jgi:hypothetical protein
VPVVSLKPADRAFLDRADSTELVTAIARRKPLGPWLTGNNSYSADPSRRIRWERRNHRQPNSRHIADYLAASLPTHCADGWGYLGRAIIAAVQGDADTSRHLAYYAELRAALAILATSGLGVFNRHHAVLDSSGTAHTRKGSYGTHQMAWLALDRWSRSRRGTDALGRIVRPEGATLDGWIDALQVAGSWKALGGTWLRQWGLDLRRLTADRDDRNVASYQPTAIPEPVDCPPQDVAKFVQSLWWHFEPMGSDAFERLDLELLRRALSLALSQGATPASGHERAIRRAAEAVIASPTRRERILPVLLSKTAVGPGESIVDLAGRDEHRSHAHHHLHVMARSALLLRVASGLTLELYGRAGVALADFEFWWQHMGLSRGLWSSQARPEYLTDLWVDVEDALSAIEERGATSEAATYHTLVQACGDAFPTLSGCERIALWSFAS